jgi:methionine biosynthesis protein MetW
MLHLSKQCIVTLPNLGFWKCRIDLALGRMPVTPNLPSSWYETKNLHLCTIRDFEGLCESEGFVINERFYLNDKGAKNILSSAMPNAFASEGVYLLARK